MMFSGFELIWLFFIYSFLGWILETVVAAMKQKKFVNRGLVNLPFCILYGVAAVFITVFGRELQGIWLYIGSVIMITVFKWAAGHLIEKIYHERWWDYSKKRWNIEGYATLPDSACLGIFAVVMIKWGNPVCITIFRMLSKTVQNILIWLLLGFLLVDIAATLIVLHDKKHKAV